MSTTATPSSPSSGGLRRTLLIVGSVLVLGLIGFLVVTGFAASRRADASREIAIAESFEVLEITAEVADVRVGFADVAEATLDFAQNDDRRNMSFEAEVVGSTLRVSVIDHGVGWWMPFNIGRSPLLTITLPESLAGLDFTMDSDVGDVALNGDFSGVDFVGNVGDLRLEGSADRVQVETTVGDVIATRYDVSDELVVRSNTGDVRIALDSVPNSIDLNSNVGDQELVLPRGSYRVETTTNVGEVSVEVENDPRAETVLRLETTVGDISVRN